ncbi:MAG: BatA domain-containing protein [Candidatus Methylacidiphilales bacterium]
MTFLAPALLGLLPLALAPVVLHLLNRMRHRTVRWGAMMFLLAATRESTRHAKLRQWLILACRCLALAALLLALARPMVGSWFGGGGPDMIVVVADRSASMERLVPGQDRSLREALLLAARDRLNGAGRRARLAVLDSAGARVPVDVADAAYLGDLAARGPTGTGTDLPALLRSAVSWIDAQRPGATEVWLLTDLQRSNLRPDTGNWAELVDAIQSYPAGLGLRLLTQAASGDGNRALRLLSVQRRERGRSSELEVTVAVVREGEGAEPVPVALGLQGSMTEEVWELIGRESVHRWTVPMEGKDGSGWGEVRLPNDANLEDNAIFFIYQPVQPLQAWVRAEEPSVGRLLGLAVAPAPDKLSRTVQVFNPTSWPSVGPAEQALVVWQGGMPEGAPAAQLERFAREGGTVLLLPNDEPGGTWLGMRWGELAEATGDPQRVVRWMENEGPLANTSGGQRLPVDRIELRRWRPAEGGTDAIAWLEDGTVWMGRTLVGKGQVWWCGTLPVRSWSTLGDGPVLVPMMQRLMESRSIQSDAAEMFRCGESPGVLRGGVWEPVTRDGSAETPGLQPGVWRSGQRLVTFNRPDEENDADRMTPADLADLVKPVRVGWDETAAGRDGVREVELWRWLVALAALALAGEAALTLPGRAGAPEQTPREPTPAQRGPGVAA